MEPIIDKAKQFAIRAHDGQTENDTYGTPYYFHLQRTAALVQLSDGTESEIAAAWLHDTVEDTPNHHRGYCPRIW